MHTHIPDISLLQGTWPGQGCAEFGEGAPLILCQNLFLSELNCCFRGHLVIAGCLMSTHYGAQPWIPL